MNRFYSTGNNVRMKLLLGAMCLLWMCVQTHGQTAPAQPAVPAQASFVNADTSTQGNWRGVYGADGYSVAGDIQSLPSYALYGLQNSIDYVWASDSTDPRALQMASVYSRIAATWYNQTLFFDVNFTDGNSHQISFYALDWDNRGRTETVEVVDASLGTALDTENLSSFTNGVYLVWKVTGHVRVYVKSTGGPNAVISGVFFGGPPPGGPSNVMVSPPAISLAAGQNQQFAAAVTNSPNQSVTWSISPSLGSISSTGFYTSPTSITVPQAVTVTAASPANPNQPGIATVTLLPGATANFLTMDTSSEGSWGVNYGFDGYAIAGDSQSIPSYATFSIQDAQEFTWNTMPTDPQALVTGNGKSKIAAAWYNGSPFQFTVHFIDHNTHELAVYALDWDNKGRSETVQILDANTNAVLDTRSISNFANGVYLSWTLSGDVIVNVIPTGGPNGVISGVFFGGGDPPPPPAVATFVGSDAATQGNWEQVYGTDGYALASSGQNIPVYSTFVVSNELTYIWAAQTNDPRALETGTGGQRIAASWYSQHFSSPPSFTFNVDFTDGNTHQVALYALDWDSSGRAETIQIVDANTNTVLDTRNISNFANGLYLVWNISGDVNINVISTSGPNCVISGVFFDVTRSIGVSVSPQSLSLPVGQTQQFTATVTGTTNQNVVWSITPSTLGTISGTGFYTAPSTVSGSQPVTVTATSAASSSSFGSATVNLTTSSANFVNSDSSTEGNWHGTYGGDGYSVVNDSQLVPGYATFSVVGPNGEYTWAPYTSDPRALETGNNAGRIAACWYKNHESFTFNIAFNDGKTHQVALYALDWDEEGRYESVEVLDATTNALLDSRTVSNFQNGVYLIWNISGSVVINVAVEGGGNAVISGVFFGGATSSGGGGAETVTVNPSGSNLMGGGTQQFTATVTNGTGQPTWTISGVTPTGAASGTISTTGLYTAPATVTVATTVTITATAADGAATGTATVNLSVTNTGGGATATFVAPLDTITEGNWTSKYGADGYEIPNVGASPPSYATFSTTNAILYTWNSSTTDPRALELPSAAGAEATTWFNPGSFTINVSVTGGTHQVAVYALDWDYLGRNETFKLTDTNSGTLLDTETISSFGNGVYLVWNISGNVTISVTANSSNAVVSGVFFEPTSGGGGGTETVMVSPSTINLMGGGTQQFTATVTDGTGQPTWTISGVSPTGAAAGTLSSTGLYTAPASVTVATTVTIKATAADGKASGTATASLSVTNTGSAGTATFVSPEDTATEGNWKVKYGTDGYEIPNVGASPPSYATFAVSNATAYTWNPSTADPRALAMPSGAGGVASTWFNPTVFSFSVSISDGGTHQVALYALDWDSIGRNETITVLDAKTGTLLDSETVSNFANGVYLVWNISGNVTINVTANAQNAAVSGVFFEPTSGGSGATETVTVGPSSSNLTEGGTQQFTATVTNGTGQPTWTISNVSPTGAAQGTVSSTGLYTAPTTVTVATTVTIKATAADGLASGTATVNLSATTTGAGATATFVSPMDTTTQGSWKAKYGADGYEIPNVGANPPSYVTFAVQNATAYTWNSNTADARALEMPSGAGAVASTWFNPTAFNINLNITDGGTHQVALYALDWDNLGRMETINVTNTQTGAVLDSKTISNFSDGVYLVWNISGNVTINVVSSASNAVISGVFFEPTSGGSSGGAETVVVSPSSASLQGGGTKQLTATVTNGTGQPTWTISNVSPAGAAQGSVSSTGLYAAPATVTVATVVTIKATAADGLASGTATVNLNVPSADGNTATFVSPMDTTTEGSWKGKYGAAGYEIPNVGANPPSYGTFSVENATTYTWAANTSDPRALQLPNGTGGWASTWFNPTVFGINLSITDNGTHQVAVYALDWDNSGRVETINVIDPQTGTVLDSRTISNFTNGVYLVWNISGSVQISVASTVSNAVISGVFFQ
jgi:hypothetical protein